MLAKATNHSTSIYGIYDFFFFLTPSEMTLFKSITFPDASGDTTNLSIRPENP